MEHGIMERISNYIHCLLLEYKAQRLRIWKMLVQEYLKK